MNVRATDFEVIAHRGASTRAPENSLPALREALALGVGSVEIDVQLSKDGVPVLFHDHELRPKTGTTGRVCDQDSRFLEQLDIGRWFDDQHPDTPERFAGTCLAMLPRVFAEFGEQFRYHIELKSGDRGLAKSVVDAVSRFALFDRVTITSFRTTQLAETLRLAPNLPRCWLLHTPSRLMRFAPSRELRLFRRRFHQAARARMEGVAIPAAALTESVVQEAHKCHLRIRAWRVRSDQDMENAIRCGADGMTTDWPERGLAIAPWKERKGSP